MALTRRRPSSVSLALSGLLALIVSTAATAQRLPSRLSDAQFWKLVTEFSEPTGTFPSENFLSNEAGYQSVIPKLLRTTKPGGVYLGVGPEQNFTYIAALRPKIAFIVDIRRQAILQHLLYKAVFELSKDRAEFLSLLFSRPRVRGLDRHSTPLALFAAYDSVAVDSAMFTRTLARITERLIGHHDFALSSDDVLAIRHVYEIICRDGVHLNYGSGNRLAGSPNVRITNPLPPRMITVFRTGTDGRVDTLQSRVITAPNGRVDTMALPKPVTFVVRGGRVEGNQTFIDGVPIRAAIKLPTGTSVSAPVPGAGRGGLSAVRGGLDYASLMVATDGAGAQRSYLATEANFRAVRDLQRRNLVVPVVGDFAGPTALRSVGRYLSDHHAVVTAFYTSNVEQYLFQNRVWLRFYANVAALPIDSVSTFIRSLPASALGSIGDLLAAVVAGRVDTYANLRELSRP